MTAWLALGVAAASAAVWCVLGLMRRGWRDAAHRLVPAAADALQRWPSVAVLVPARDEADHLPRTLPALLDQAYPGPLRVVLIDDASSDATPEVLRRLHAEHPRADRLLTVHLTGEPPPGWMGKCWAIEQGRAALADAEGAAGSRSTWICHTDADIDWHPDLLRSAVARLEQNGRDVLGLATRLRPQGLLETAVQLNLMVALAVLFPIEKALDPASPVALTGGAFILVRRARYEAIGGHAAVAGEMVEDLALGRALKQDGCRMDAAAAGSLQSCRMYDDWADMREGLTKNAAAGLGYSRLRATGLIAATLLFNVSPPLLLLASLGMLLGGSGGAVWAATGGVASLAWISQARVFVLACRLSDLSPSYAWSAPLGALIYCGFVIESFRKARTGGNLWKGRRYGITGRGL